MHRATIQEFRSKQESNNSKKGFWEGLTQLQRQFIIKFTIRLIFTFSSVILTYMYTTKKGYILVNVLLGLFLSEIAVLFISFLIGLLKAAISMMLMSIFLPLTLLGKKKDEKEEKEKMQKIIEPSESFVTVESVIRGIGEFILRVIFLQLFTYMTLQLTKSKLLIIVGIFFGILIGQIITKTIKIEFNKEAGQILKKNDLKKKAYDQ